MKYQKVIIFNLAIIVTGVALYYVVSNRASLFNKPADDTSQTQTLTDGTVTYKVIPKDLSTQAATWDFEISLDTHTGSLDQDMVAIIRLVDDKGNEYKAMKWDGDPPGSHHREGMLQFSPITPRPAFIELNIQTTGTTGKNSLRWNI